MNYCTFMDHCDELGAELNTPVMLVKDGKRVPVEHIRQTVDSTGQPILIIE